VRWRRGRGIACAVALVVVLWLPVLNVAAASPVKKAGSTILLFLGSESDEGREDGSISDGEDPASENSVPAEVDEAPPAWDEFSEGQDSQRSDEDLDPGSWSQVLEQPSIWDSRNPRVCHKSPKPMVHINFNPGSIIISEKSGLGFRQSLFNNFKSPFSVIEWVKI
jgi:hypothetical protein